MRGLPKIFLAGMLAMATLGFAVWWNYATVAMSYPAYKLRLRQRTWRVFGDPLDWEARRIAGLRAVDCGVLGKDARAANRIAACISTARLDRRGFRIRFSVCGIDSCGAEGLVGSPDGAVYQLSLGVSHGAVTLKRRTCPSPLGLGETDFGNFYLYCLPKVESEDEIEVLRRDWNPQARN
jgi:hypothetical protein